MEVYDTSYDGFGTEPTNAAMVQFLKQLVAGMAVLTPLFVLAYFDLLGVFWLLVLGGLALMSLGTGAAWILSRRDLKKRGYFISIHGGKDRPEHIFYEELSPSGEVRKFRFRLDNDGTRFPTVVLVPSEKYWDLAVEDWMAGRHTEILNRLRAKFSPPKYIIRDHEEKDL